MNNCFLTLEISTHKAITAINAVASVMRSPIDMDQKGWSYMILIPQFFFGNSVASDPNNNGKPNNDVTAIIIPSSSSEL
jgi:hypothetical protein